MAPKTRVKERAEEQSHSMPENQQASIHRLANDLHRLNNSIMKAVDEVYLLSLSALPVTMAATETGAICWFLLLLQTTTKS